MNNLKKCLSVLICTNNRLKQLQECLSSIVKERKLIDEVIIVDSSDRPIDCKKLLGRKAYRGIKLRYLSTEIKSIPHSRNILLKEAKNELCVFVDDDVKVDDGIFLQIYNDLIKHKKAVVIGGVCRFNEKNIYSEYSYKIFFNHVIQNRKDIVEVEFSPTMIFGFKKSYLEKNNIMFDERIKNLEDVDLCLQIKMNGGKILIDKNVTGVHKYRNNFRDFYFSFFGYYSFLRVIYDKYNIDFLGLKKYFKADNFKDFNKLRYFFDRYAYGNVNLDGGLYKKFAGFFLRLTMKLALIQAIGKKYNFSEFN